MAESAPIRLENLSDTVNRVLSGFVDAAQNAFGADLISVVLYGSAAEGRLRPTSDVNVLLVLSTFEQAKADRLREETRLAHAAIQLKCMFLLQSEISQALRAFAVKFDDILHRHRILYGNDPFSQLSIPREAMVYRLKQVLLNLILRLRELYTERSLREEQLALVIADMAGPLRSCAATLLELKGEEAPSPKEALQRVVSSFSESGGNEALDFLSQARENRILPPGAAGPLLFRLIDWAKRMQTEVEKLS